MRGSVAMFARNDLQNDSRVWKEARLLKNEGLSVKLVGIRSSATSNHEVRDGIDVVRVSPFQFHTGLFTPSGAKNAGAVKPSAGAGPFSSKRVLPLPGLKTRLRGVLSYAREEIVTGHFALQSLGAAGSAVDVYHAHDLNTAQAALLARAVFGGKVVYDAHEFWSERNFYRRPGKLEHARLRSFERKVCREADAVITVSEGIAGELQSRYDLEKRPAVVMNAPERNPVERRGQPLTERLGVDGKVLLYIGLVTTHRGLEVAIEALKGLSDVHLALLGPVSRPLQERLESMVSAAGLTRRVHWLGSVRPDEVVDIASGADAALVLIQNVCLSYYYCSPNKLFESLAAGLPVVASDFPDLRRVMEGHEVGALVDPSNVENVQKGIAQVLGMDRDAVFREATALAAKFRWRYEAEKLLHVYQKLLA